VDLDSLSSSPVGSQHTRSPDLAAIKDSGSDDRVQEVHLGRDILEVKLKALPLKQGKITISLRESGLKSMPQAKLWLFYFNLQASVGHGNLDIPPLEVEVAVKETALWHIEDNDLSFTKTDRQLLKIT
jgi:hypothetical protein